MTLIDQSPAPAEDAPGPRSPGTAAPWRRLASSPALLAVALAALAFAVRSIGIVRTNDVFIDELIYATFASQVADGVIPHEGGRAFLLHPPASLAINGLVIHVSGISGSPVDLVLGLRWVNAVLGAATVALVFLLVRRVVNHPVAIGAAAVVALDPFLLRNNGRVMIETPAVLFLVAGWLVLVSTAYSPSRTTAHRGAIAAGLLLGMALVTKDMTVVPGAVAVAVAALWRRSVPLGTAVRVVLASAVPYLLYLAFLSSAGLVPLWLQDKSSGVLRMLGVDQETGFNAVPVSLTERLVEEISRFGTSYVLLALALPAGAVAAFSRVPAQRFVGVVAVCTGLMGAYAALGGAAEEQFGYYVVISAVPALAVAGRLLVAGRRGLGRVAVGLGVLLVAATCVLGIASRAVSDDGFVRAAAWMEEELPTDADVGVTGVTGEYAFPQYDVSDSLTALLANENDFVLTSSAPLEQGYGYASPELPAWLEDNARPVFTYTGPSNGDTVVWRLDPEVLRQAVAAGVTLPPAEIAAE